MKLHIKTVSKTVKLTITAAAIGVFFASDALACGVRPGFGPSPSVLLSPLQQFQSQPSLAEALPALTDGQTGKEGDSEHGRTSLVGMWTVNFFVAGQTWDVAIEQFYADGNEMTNDIAVPPGVGNICWGVWERVSNRVYEMKHIGWSFDANGVYAGRFDLTATLELSRDGDSFNGKFVADQEDLSGNPIPAQHAVGTLKAARFKIG
jgi:hypothetical protein